MSDGSQNLEIWSKLHVLQAVLLVEKGLPTGSVGLSLFQTTWLVYECLSTALIAYISLGREKPVKSDQS